MELPPRTRRILARTFAPSTVGGTTSAHAENTPPIQTTCQSAWNYLRARGEYAARRAQAKGSQELPPRTRRIRISGKITMLTGGTTSAHAENTACSANDCNSPRNYLRARGEYGALRFGRLGNLELPPRTRRILLDILLVGAHRGTTSAHAENTTIRHRRAHGAWNYLRARGEYIATRMYKIAYEELPPRTRRIR